MSEQNLDSKTDQEKSAVSSELKPLLCADHSCELCGNAATHFCECERCREDTDDDGTEIECDGRWLCDDCGLEGE